MKKIDEYIIHRSIVMNDLVAMVHESLLAGYQPYGDLIAVPVITNMHGEAVTESIGGYASIAYIQAMVHYEPIK